MNKGHGAKLFTYKIRWQQACNVCVNLKQMQRSAAGLADFSIKSHHVHLRHGGFRSFTKREREHVGNAASPHKNNYMSLCALFAPKLPSCEMQAKWKKVKRSSSSPKGQQHRDPTLSGIFGRRRRASWGILRGPLISRKHPSHDVIFLSRQKLAKQTPKSSRYLEGGKDPHPQDKIQHLDFTKDTRPLYYKTPPCAFHHRNVRSKAVFGP